MAKYFCICDTQLPYKITVLLLCEIIPLIFQYGSLAEEVTFDYDCSQVACTTDTESCPPDSIEREPAPAFDVLYGPEELMSPHDFYDEVDELGDAVEQHFDELPMELSEVRALPATTNSTTSQLNNSKATKEEGPELVLVKRELQFDHGPTEDIDAHERMRQMCCPTITLESLRRRRRRRSSTSVEDCKCKACKPLPQCSHAEVAIKVHEAKGVPGDCCPTYACAPKRECGEADAKPYWRDACTRCSCYGESGPELCHNVCPMDEMNELETQRSCYATNSIEPMLHGSDWYENDWCTKCHCENGERECVGSLCLPTTCSNPVKVAGQCCPQCPVGVENILIAHENATDTSLSSAADKVLQDEFTTTATVSTAIENSTTIASTVFPTVAPTTLSTIESTTESSTAPIAPQNETTSTEEHTELVHSSSISTEITASSTEVAVSTTETSTTTTTRNIDDIAAEVYFGPMIYTSTEESNTSTQELLNQTVESTTQSTLEPQTDISSSNASTSAESTSTVEPTLTTSFGSSNNETVSTETSTMEASNSTENSTELSTTSSASLADNASPTVAAIYNEVATSTETAQETPLANSNTETTTTINFQSTASTTTEMDSTNTTTAISSTTSTDASTTISTTTLLPVDRSSTQLYSPSTSSPHVSTFTTNSPYSSTAATQTVSTVVYWYTFSTSAPSPPVPQPTIYQPSVRKFFTRPEVRYIGATVFVAFTVLCALAVWKFCMPTRSDRLKNHYRTVPSSEATSLSHISSTSHSSMA